MNNGYSVPNSSPSSAAGSAPAKKSTKALVAMIGAIVFAAAAFGMMFLPLIVVGNNAGDSVSVSIFEYSSFVSLTDSNGAVFQKDEVLSMIGTVLFILMAVLFLVVAVCKVLNKVKACRIICLIVSIIGVIGGLAVLIYGLLFGTVALIASSVGASGSLGVATYLTPLCTIGVLVFSIIDMTAHRRRENYAFPAASNAGAGQPIPPMNQGAPAPAMDPMGSMPPMNQGAPAPAMDPMGSMPPMDQGAPAPAADPMGFMPPMDQGAPAPAADPMGFMPPMDQGTPAPAADPMGFMPPMDQVAPAPAADPMGFMPPMDQGVPAPAADPMGFMPPMDSVQPQPFNIEANQVPIVPPTPLGDFQVDPLSQTIPVVSPGQNPDFDPDDPPTTVQEGGLIGISGDYQGADIPMRSGEKILIGRDASVCNLVIGAETKDISRTHCSVKYDAYINCYKVIDMSSNGTFVNGQQLPKNQEAQLPAGTVISLGKGTNKFKLKG